MKCEGVVPSPELVGLRNSQISSLRPRLLKVAGIRKECGKMGVKRVCLRCEGIGTVVVEGEKEWFRDVDWNGVLNIF